MIRAIIILVLLALSTPVKANDVDVAKRSVTRVIVAVELPDGRSGESFGSGFAVGRDKIVTNAHVVRLAQQYPRNSLVVIVPSEGSKPFLARIDAYDAGKDLALLSAIDANLPALTIYSGALQSGTDVATLGYPANVDQATIRNLREFITPQEPVLAEGNFSNIRTIRNIEALIHNANIARGNSGGPLVDECGRVLGVNTFQTANDSGDSSFAFASSARELMRFLRRAGVEMKTIGEKCITAAEFAALETERKKEQEEAQKEEAEQLAALQRDALEKAEKAAERAIVTEREEMLFLAMLLLLGGVIVIGGGFVLMARSKEKKAIAIALLTLGAILAIAGIWTFLQRPALNDRSIAERIDEQRSENDDSETLSDDLSAANTFDGSKTSDSETAQPTDQQTRPSGPVTAGKSSGLSGELICTIDRSRSRITTSVTDDIPLDWKDGGCVNGQTQYAPLASGKGWSRLLVPNQERTVSRLTYSPELSELVMEKYALDLETMENVRDLRANIDTKSCTVNDAAIERLSEQQGRIDEMLPQYSEKLVYNCR